MNAINKSMTAAVLLLGAGAFALPALAQNGAGMMGQGSESGGGMGGMMGQGMAEGCIQMMQAMPNGGGARRPNEQWRGQESPPDRGRGGAARL